MDSHTLKEQLIMCPHYSMCDAYNTSFLEKPTMLTEVDITNHKAT